MHNHPYYAHTAPDGRTQTIKAHLQGAAELAEKFAEGFGAAELAYFTGLCHDIGKYSAEFQRRLSGDQIHVDHATAGAWECFKRQQISAALAIMGHHGGLPDGGTQTDTNTTFWGRINKAQDQKLADHSAWQKEIALPVCPPEAMRERKAWMFFVRMLYSCLVDADYLDTERFMDDQTRESVAADMEYLWQRLTQYVAGWFPPKTVLNEQRCHILQQCMREGEKRAPGLYTLTVPTGGGKTIASLAFALAQAKSAGLRRIIYVIPYTSIIEQTADVFRDVLGAEYVLEHHSAAVTDTEGESSHFQMKAAENWDMPVIVTTAVQFFESLFACKPLQCRKLHNISQSVVIFDEAQMLPQPYLRPCVYAIAELVKNYGVSAVLCTATQPALEPFFRAFLPDIQPIELCPPTIYRREVFRRVSFRSAGKCPREILAAELNRVQQGLCVVNSRKEALALFDLLESEGAFHLSTLMCPAHRRQQLAHIRERLKDGRPCRVISTSLIEAGVDVDFPRVWREEAGLDSMLQAAGRCNREGKRSIEESIVTLFQCERPAPHLFRAAIAAGRYAMQQNEDLTSSAAIHAYFRELFDLKGEEQLDQKHILPTMETSLFPFSTVASAFHLIETETKTVYIPWNNEAEGLLKLLQTNRLSRVQYRKLGQYGVSIYPQHFDALMRAGAIVCLEDGTAILCDQTLYQNTTGLALAVESGQAHFI